MTMGQTEMTKYVWRYLKNNGMTDAGAAGMMGNIYAESGMNPICLENLCIKRYRERRGVNYTSESYMELVDSGSISRGEFLRPMGLQYAWGFCQWSSPDRKAGLYDLCRKKKVSIGDSDTQLEYLITELKNSFPNVWTALSDPTKKSNVRAASDIVLKQFEQPADTGAAIQAQRYQYSMKYYEQFHDRGKHMTVNEAIDLLLGVAADEIGYLEKKSNAQLDDKKANAGYGNHTKFWAELYPSFQGQPWCAIFVSWCLYKAFGIEAAQQLLKHWPFTYCPTLAAMTANMHPERGAVILFWRNGEYAHTGIVENVSGGIVTTIEGNTSAGSEVIPNGGGVYRKSYRLSDLSSKTKYFMPNYEIVADTPDTPEQGEKYMFTVDTVKSGSTGKSAVLMQRLLKGSGYKGADGKELVIDGDIGKNSIYALKAFQAKKGLDVDGVCGPKTWAALIGV